LTVAVAGTKELRLIWTVAVDAGVAGAAPTTRAETASNGSRSFFMST
jgi:hypothetical protein